MEENNLISAPQAAGNIDLALFLLLTEPTAERTEYMATAEVLAYKGAEGYCPTIYL